MTHLSVNINKIATLRNARGGNVPDLVQFTKDIESFGAQGITVHPRPDERHIRYQDVFDLKPVVKTEFNIEGNPIAKFIDLVLRAKPAQVTLVPDAVDAITSNAGWDTIKHKDFLKEVISEFKRNNIRTSIFVDPNVKMVEQAANTGADRIELYTEAYAEEYGKGNKDAVKTYTDCAKIAIELDLGLNAGHDLSLQNIQFFKQEVPGLLEVSIGHALITESLYFGLEATIKKVPKSIAGMIKLNSTVLGEGIPFLILHGFLGMSDNWKTIGNKFAEDGYQVHLIDQRNHGRSPHTSEMNYQVMSQDIKDYCDENNLENIILLGHSMGGKVAMQVAGDFSFLIQKLIIVDIGPKYYPPHHQEILKGLQALDDTVITSRGEAGDFLAKFIPDTGTRLFLLKNLYWKTKEKLSLRLNLEVLSEAGEAIGLGLSENIKFSKPTLFIKGGNSNYITEEDKPIIKKHFPDSTIESITGAGHWVHAEKMNDFYLKVSEFL